MRDHLEGHWKTNAELALEKFPVVIFDSCGIRKFFSSGETTGSQIIAAELERIIPKLPNLFDQSDRVWDKIMRKRI